jgi:hypothetical protein
VRLLRLGQGLEPLRQLGIPFLAGGLGHAGIHLGVLVGLARHRGLEILLRLADGLAGGRVTDLLEEVEMPEGMARLRVGGVLEQAGDIREALDVGHPREVKVAPIGLRLAREGLLQVLVALAALQTLPCHGESPLAPAVAREGRSG